MPVGKNPQQMLLLSFCHWHGRKYALFSFLKSEKKYFFLFTIKNIKKRRLNRWVNTFAFNKMLIPLKYQITKISFFPLSRETNINSSHPIPTIEWSNNINPSQMTSSPVLNKLVLSSLMFIFRRTNKAWGCSTNTVVIKSFSKWLSPSMPLPSLKV